MEVNICKIVLSYILLLILVKPNRPVNIRNTPIIHIQKILNINPTASFINPTIKRTIYPIPTKHHNK